MAALVILVMATRWGGRALHPCTLLESKLCREFGKARCSVLHDRYLSSLVGTHGQHWYWRHLPWEFVLHGVLGWDRDRSHTSCTALLMNYSATRDTYGRLIPAP